jgi:hypothetical protein
MKTAIIITDGLKQIMFTPENEVEKEVLKLFTVNDNISIEPKRGTLYDEPPECARGYTMAKSSGNYYRAYECEESLMFILKPKK